MEKPIALGYHTILELYDCESDRLDDVTFLESTMIEASQLAKATIIKSHFHQFSPQGVSGSVIIAESHFNIHTWPEHGYAAIDLFTCGVDLQADAAVQYLVEQLQCRRHTKKYLKRGTEYHQE